ncbi:VirB4 family type IV secretion/conjugal transfer ATPase [Yoonia sp. MH D7]
MALDLTAVAASIVAQRNVLKNGFMHVPYVTLVNDHTVRLRDNSFMSCIRVDGLNAATTSDSDLDGMKNAFAGVIAQMGQNFTVYTHKISRKVDLTENLEPLKNNDFAAAVDQRWREGLAEGELRDTRLTISIVRTGRLKKTAGLFRRASNLIEGSGDARDLDLLEEVCRFMRTAIGGDATRLLKASTGDLLGFLGSVQTANERPIYPSGALTVVADDVLSDRVTFTTDGFELSDGPFGDRYGQILALKSYPSQSWVTIFDDFALPCDYVISQSFSPMGNNEAADLIERKQRIMSSTADRRANAREAMGALQEGVLVQELSLGKHQLTISIIDPSETRVRDVMSELAGVATNVGAILIKDNFVKRAHYFAQFPGNIAHRARRNVITNVHFADYASLHRTPLGKTGDEVPWKTPIAVFPTAHGSSYRFNFHRRGTGDGEPPAGHTLVLGETGSGKSVLAAFLLAQARRADTRIFVFDYRRGLEIATRAMGGSYSTIESGMPTGLNPLWVETDDEGTAWLTDWLANILSPNDELSPLQTRSILENVRRNASAAPSLRRWDTFAKQFASTDDEGLVQTRVSEWAKGGRFGWVFGETVEDTFSLDGDVVGFDLTQILDAQSDRERTAVLSYIFRRIERKMRDRKRTIVLIDEAWKAIDNPYFAKVIEGWLATLRKQNAVVVMLTQNASQLSRSKVGERVFSFFPTQILFPDGKSSYEDYDALRLNPAELDIVTSRASGRNFLLRDDENSVVLNGDMSALGDHLHLLGGGSAGLSIAGQDFRETPDFWRRAT